LNATASLEGRPYSVLCAPVTDSLSGACLAVLYFEAEVTRAFGPAELTWLTAYAVALGQALTLHICGQKRMQQLEAECRKVRDTDGPRSSATVKQLASSSTR